MFDGTDDPAEGLATLHASESNETLLRRYLWLAPLSLQPIGRDPRDPPQTALSPDGRRRATSRPPPETTRSSWSWRPLVRRAGPRDALRFDVDSIVYAQAGSNLEERFEQVRRVTDGSGRVLPFDHRLDELVVALAEPAPAGQPLKLRFEIDGDFLVRPRGDSYWELGIWPWFPLPPLSGQAYTFRSEVRVPEPFVPFAPGKTVRRETEGAENVLETRIDTPIQFAVILAGRTTWRRRAGRRDDPGRDLRARQPARPQEPHAGRRGVIAYYPEFLGPFPFPEFNILEINDYGFGQAPPATMFITKEAFDPLVGDMSRLRGAGDRQDLRPRDRAPVLGHRRPDPEPRGAVAGGVVLGVLRVALHEGPPEPRDASEVAQEAVAPRRRLRGRRRADPARQPRLGCRRRRSRAAIRNGLLYDKGPILLAALHREMGDAAFLAFLRSCQSSLAWKFGTTKEIARLLQAAAARDFLPFFEKYYWGVEMPED